MTALLRLPSPSSWLLPSGEIVESPFQPEGAVPSPITTVEINALLDHSINGPVYKPDLRYLCYAALGVGDSRYAFVPLWPGERALAVRRCASQLEMSRAMGAKL